MNPMSLAISTALSMMSACGDDVLVAQFQNAVSKRANGGSGNYEALAVPVQFQTDANPIGTKSIKDLVALFPALAPISAKLNAAKWATAIGTLSFPFTPGGFNGFLYKNGAGVSTKVAAAGGTSSLYYGGDNIVWNEYTVTVNANATVRFNGIILIYIES